MSFARKFRRILLSELALLRHRPLPLAAALLLPLIAWACIAVSLRDAVIDDIPLYVVDGDNSRVSRMLCRSLDATQALRVTEVSGNEERARRAMENGDVSLIVYIPRDVQRAIAGGGSARMVVLVDGRQLLHAKIAYRAVAMSAYTVSAGITVRRFEARGMGSGQAQARALPIHTEIHAVGNSWYDYALYLAPGMMMAILQMSASFSALWFFREHRDRDARLLLPARGETAAFFLARITPLFLANAIAVLLLFVVMFPLAGVPNMQALPALYWRSLLFALVCMGMGALLSGLFRNLVSAAQIGIIINAPAFVFSGYTFPRWAMPDGIRAFAEIIPLTHVLDGFFPLILYNRSTMDGIPALLLFFLLFWGGSVLLATRPGDRFRARERWLMQRIRLRFSARAAASARQIDAGGEA